MPFTLTPLQAGYAVCRLEAHSPVPAWALAGEFFSVSRTQEELSVVCEERQVPRGVRSERGWRAWKLEGPFDFALTGVLLSVLEPLAEAGVGVFAVSTFDTDYVMVKAAHAQAAVGAWRAAGHRVRGPG